MSADGDTLRAAMWRALGAASSGTRGADDGYLPRLFAAMEAEGLRVVEIPALARLEAAAPQDGAIQDEAGLSLSEWMHRCREAEERGQNLVDALGMEREMREAASEECREWQDAARTWQDNFHAAEAQRDALAEALRWVEKQPESSIPGAYEILQAIRRRARAALAEAGLEQ